MRFNAKMYHLVTVAATLVVAAGLALVSCTRSTPGIFYVASDGNDSWSGTRATVNWFKTDGPFASVAHALVATRAWRKSSTANARAATTIFLGPGVYPQTEPLILRPEDSELTITTSSLTRPVLSGGRRITGWKTTQREGKDFWTAEIPEVRNGHWFFRELWINGRRAIRARQPNQGYLKVAGLFDPGTNGTRGQTRFQYAGNDIKPWSSLTQGEVVVMNRWVESRLPISGIEETPRMIRFSKRAVFPLDKGDLYYLEGVFEALDQPGEWFLDRNAGTLYYLPRPGETLAQLDAVAPVVAQVLRLEGQPTDDRAIDHVTFRGVAFAHTEWCFPEGFADPKNRPQVFPEPDELCGGFAQAEIGVPGAVWGQGVRNSTFENCAFYNLGNYGLELARGCQSNRVTHCEFADLGAGGVKLGETTVRSAPSEQTRANQISSCQIHDGGQMFHSSTGIWIGQSPANVIVHNHIHDFYWTGMSIGWTWGYTLASASSNLVAFNHVHHIGVKSDGDGPILSDMGAIYTLGKQPGTLIENNLCHDIAALRYGGWGLYFDEGSSGIMAISNVIYRTTHGGFHQNYGETNFVLNNIFAFGRDEQLQRSRVEPRLSFSLETNIVYFDTGALLGGDWSQDKYQIDWNVYFDARPGATAAQMRFSTLPFTQWRARGHDTNSVIADPLFLAPAQYDFRLQPGSPALKLGFKQIDLKDVGPD